MSGKIITVDFRRDTLFAAFHWGGDGNANILTHAALDPVSRIPEFKVCAARIAPHAPQHEAPE